jgi:hypothetical protein
VVLILAGEARAADTDVDGVDDSVDNCTLAMNANQRDTDADGFGSICDPDFNNDGVVNAVDLATLKAQFFKATANQDVDGNGIVNVRDLALLKAKFFQAPGPTAWAAAEIYAVTPTENSVAASVYVMGRRFNQGTMSAKLVDPARPLASLPLLSTSVDSENILRVSIPSFTTGDAGERARYRLQVSQNTGTGDKPARPKVPPDDPTPGKQTDLYLRSDAPGPQDASIYSQVVLVAGAYTHYQSCTPEQDPPWCQPNLVVRTPPPYNFGSTTPPFLDSWDDVWFADTADLFFQASRDWGTACGRVWAPGLSTGIRGFADVVPPKIVIWPPLGEQFPVDDPVLTGGFAQGELRWWGPDTPSGEDISLSTQDLTSNPPYSLCQAHEDDPNCGRFMGARSDALLIVVASKMSSGPDEIDPLDQRDQWLPQYGMLVISLNPCLGCFHPLPVNQVVPPPLVLAEEEGSYAPVRPLVVPQATPNLLAHALLHAFGYGDTDHPGHLTVSDAYGDPPSSNPPIWRGYALGPPPQSAPCASFLTHGAVR